jgi:hypothetical protein
MRSLQLATFGAGFPVGGALGTVSEAK